MKMVGSRLRPVAWLGPALGLALAAQTVTAQGGWLSLVSPENSVDFGQRGVGLAGSPLGIALGNSGTATLDISSVTLAGQHPLDFSVLEDDCTGAALLPEQTCNIVLDFTPVSPGARSARLRLVDSASGSPHELPLSGLAFDPLLPARRVGPIDVRHGFPIWYQDDTGLRVTLCYLDNGLCSNPLPNPAQPPAVKDGSLNFPEEAFWTYAEAEIPRLQKGARARLILSKEAAFLPGPPGVAQQVAFDRVRVRIDRLVPGGAYVVTHPFGVLNLTAEPDGEIDYTSDIGCGGPPCDFGLVLNGPLATHLRWDPSVPPAAPAGFLGDPAVLHRVVGSPLGTNVFRLSGPGVGTIETDLFVVEGRLFTPATPLDVSDAEDSPAESKRR